MAFSAKNAFLHICFCGWLKPDNLNFHKSLCFCLFCLPFPALFSSSTKTFMYHKIIEFCLFIHVIKNYLEMTEKMVKKCDFIWFFKSLCRKYQKSSEKNILKNCHKPYFPCRRPSTGAVILLIFLRPFVLNILIWTQLLVCTFCFRCSEGSTNHA